jgi:histidyl-tRNA synthetase
MILLLDGLLRTISSNKISFSVRINSLGCPGCRPQFREALDRFLQERKDKLCDDCRRRMVKNPLRVLDCKIDAEKFLEAPTPLEFLCATCREYFEKVQKILRDRNGSFEVFPRLVRGLDYYTGTVFEVVSEKLGAQNALGAGGRYDTLVSDLGGPPTPAVGFAIGLDRVVELLGKGAVQDSSSPALGEGRSVGQGVFVVVLGEEASQVGFNMLDTLREAGFSVPGLLPNDSLKSQMRYANSCGARWAVILGDRELQDKSAMVKDLLNSSQQKVPLEDLVSYLKKAGSAGKP